MNRILLNLAKEVDKRNPQRLKILSDKTFLKIKYYSKFEKKLNLRNPKTFNEKLQWLKIYNRKDNYKKLVDKYLVRDYIKETIGERYLIPILGVWDKFDDIDFNELPDKFVLKTTHDSGTVIICENKENINVLEIREKISDSLKRNYFYSGREWPYKFVKPRIIAEKFIEDIKDGDLKDFKLFCFNGKVQLILVCSDRFDESGLKETFFDTDWNRVNIKRKTHSVSKIKIEKPNNLKEMIVLAEILSKEMTFLRVDFYDVNNTVYFGELTFFPASGFEGFIPFESDRLLGDWLNIKNSQIR